MVCWFSKRIDHICFGTKSDTSSTCYIMLSLLTFSNFICNLWNINGLSVRLYLLYLIDTIYTLMACGWPLQSQLNVNGGSQMKLSILYNRRVHTLWVYCNRPFPPSYISLVQHIPFYLPSSVVYSLQSIISLCF